MKSEFQIALENGAKPGARFYTELSKIDGFKFKNTSDARAYVNVLNNCLISPNIDNRYRRLKDLLDIFDDIDDFEAYKIIRFNTFPVLTEFLNDNIDKYDKESGLDDDLIMTIVRMFAVFDDEEGMVFLKRLGQDKRYNDGWVWAKIFQTVSNNGNSEQYLLNLLRDSIPTEFAGVAYLDFANSIWQNGKQDKHATHPFDSKEGVDRFKRIFADDDQNHFSYAVSACASFPYLSVTVFDQLIGLALKHPDKKVQIEAAWSMCKRGDIKGYTLLADHCLDINVSARAISYLEDLKAEEFIPERAKEPNFNAMAEMVSWLAHPLEFGRPPDEITLYDTREMFWPPTNDTRRLWLFIFTYKNFGKDGMELSEIGMHGSITFNLDIGEDIKKPPEDVYAYHCCWELKQINDPRAPEEESVEFGRKLLGFDK